MLSRFLDDGHKLFRDFGILAAGLVELGTLARQADPSCPYSRSIVALAKVVEHYTGKTLSKGKVRTSNWELKLSQEQTTYAANDAHCALIVYKRLLELAKEHELTVKVEDFAADLAKEYRAKTAAASQTASDTASKSTTTSTPSTAPEMGTSSAASTDTSIPSDSQPTSSANSHITEPIPGRASARPLVYAQIPLDVDTTPSPQVAQPHQPVSQPRTQAMRAAEDMPLPGEPPRPQHLRAYRMWHLHDTPLREICAALRSKENPLAESTVMCVYNITLSRS